MPAVSVDYKTAFKNAGLDFSKVEDKGVAVVVNTSGMKFVMDGEVLASLPIAPGKVAEMANKFDPKNQAHLTMKASLAQVLSTLEAKLMGGQPGTAKPASPLFTGTPTKDAKSVPGAAPQVVVQGPVDIFPADKMKTATTVALKAATQLFQPVNSTSAGSRYYVVGIGEGVAVAARLKGTKLSVRVEGTAFAKLAQKIQEAGVFGPAFAGTYNGEYASMHLAVDGKKEAQRVVGAVLGSLAPYIKHATPDLQPLVLAA